MTNQRKQTANPNTGVTPNKTQAQKPITWPPLVFPASSEKFCTKGMSEEEKSAFDNWHESLKNTIQTQFDTLNTVIATQTAQIIALQKKS